MRRLTTQSGKGRVASNTIAQVASQLFIGIIGIVILKIMTSSLGVNGYGIYATILAFVTTFSLLTDLGLNAITAREIAKAPDQADNIISYNMGLRIFMCVIMIPVIFGLSFIFYKDGSQQLHLGILLLSLYLFFDAIRSVAMAYFTSKVRGEVTAAINSFQQVILFALVIVVTIMKWHIYGYIFAFLISNLIGSLVTLHIARKEVLVRPKYNLKIWKRILGLSVSLGVIQLINMMYLKVDSILLSTIKGTAEVGIYTIAYSLILAFLTLPSFIMTALIPSMATATTDAIKAMIAKALEYMTIFASLLAVGGFIVRNDAVPLVSGKAFAAATIPFAILALASAFTYLNGVFGFASVAMNKHHKMIYVSLGALILNVILNFIFIPRYSVIGAAWATAVSELISLIGVYYIFRRETKIDVSLKPIIKPIIAAVITLSVTELTHPIWSTGVLILNLAVEITLVIVLYSALLFALKGIPSEVLGILNKRSQKIKV